MFLNNRHTLIYLSIVTRAQLRGLDKRDHAGYYEWHHVIPLSLGGPDTDRNKVLLTAREHFLCHLLLTRMTTGIGLAKMKHAFSYMALCHSGTQQRRPVGRWYALAREMAAAPRIDEWKRKISKARLGQKPKPESVEKMRKSLTGRKLSDQHREKISKNNARACVKDFNVNRPDGTAETIRNLRKFCADNNLDYQVAWLSSKRGTPIKKGPMKGWGFRALL